MDIYREIILDHYKHPRNFGHLEGADVTHTEHNVTCGDRIVMELKFLSSPPSTTVAAIRFSGEGCAISQAAASLLTEEVVDKTVEEIKDFTPQTVIDLLGVELTPTRLKCALLPLEVIHKAVNSFLSGKK
jgi:nitrogen fixation NifU-like protein